MSNQDSPTADKFAANLRAIAADEDCPTVLEPFAIEAADRIESLTRELAERNALDAENSLYSRDEALENLQLENDGLRVELAQAKERIDLLNRGQREMVLALAQLRGQLSARDYADAERAAQPSIESQAAQEYVRDPCICKSTLALIARPDCPA